MNTVLNLLSAAAVVISGAVASSASTLDTDAKVNAQIKVQSAPTFQHQPFANSAARTAAFLPATEADKQQPAFQAEPIPYANQRWVF
ncbi:hypothetical protein [Pseudomonas sp.]|uniref:hypothetical protein n=1 Tax=Pseudomonas sp. TaxID=306 RepID=UPI003A97AC40